MDKAHVELILRKTQTSIDIKKKKKKLFNITSCQRNMKFKKEFLLIRLEIFLNVGNRLQHTVG